MLKIIIQHFVYITNTIKIVSIKNHQKKLNSTGNISFTIDLQ